MGSLQVNFILCLRGNKLTMKETIQQLEKIIADYKPQLERSGLQHLSQSLFK
jgi:hypothetical protein